MYQGLSERIHYRDLFLSICMRYGLKTSGLERPEVFEK